MASANAGRTGPATSPTPARRCTSRARSTSSRRSCASSGSLRVLGSRHSFNDIADTTGDLVSLAGHAARSSSSTARRATVTVDGGVRYGELCGPLARARASRCTTSPRCRTSRSPARARPRPTARATGTATWPRRSRPLELVTADGERRRAVAATATRTTFPGAVVGLGALGVVTALTLDVEPTFDVRQDVYEDLPLAAVADHFDEITARGRQRQPVHRLARAGVRAGLAQAPGRPTATRPSRRPTLLGATRATVPIHPIRRMPADALHRAARRRPGRGTSGCRTSGWTTRPSAGAELQTEYLCRGGTRADALRRRRSAARPDRAAAAGRPRSAPSPPTTCG